MPGTRATAVARGIEDQEEETVGGGGTRDGIKAISSPSSSFYIEEEEQDQGLGQQQQQMETNDGDDGCNKDNKDTTQTSSRIVEFLGMRRKRKEKLTRRATSTSSERMIRGEGKTPLYLPLLCCSCVADATQEAPDASPALDQHHHHRHLCRNKRNESSAHLLLRSLIERNDFYSADCNVHLPLTPNNNHNSSSSNNRHLPI